MSVVIGTAGWSISTKAAASFSADGTVLQRYASRFRGVEINSSFYRPHRVSTWQRWADSVPADFRFSVKVPKVITHERKLVDCADPLNDFLEQVHTLGPKLAVLLVQLPPKLGFEPSVAADFFSILASLTKVGLVCEPRHPSWFEEEAETVLKEFGVGRVAADPAPVPAAFVPGGYPDLRYWRLHGSPTMYRSPYGTDRLAAYAELIGKEATAGRDVWCIFDNTASSAATTDALVLLGAIAEDPPCIR